MHRTSATRRAVCEPMRSLTGDRAAYFGATSSLAIARSMHPKVLTAVLVAMVAAGVPENEARGLVGRAGSSPAASSVTVFPRNDRFPQAASQRSRPVHPTNAAHSASPVHAPASPAPREDEALAIPEIADEAVRADLVGGVRSIRSHGVSRFDLSGLRRPIVEAAPFQPDIEYLPVSLDEPSGSVELTFSSPREERGLRLPIEPGLAPVIMDGAPGHASGYVDADMPGEPNLDQHAAGAGGIPAELIGKDDVALIAAGDSYSTSVAEDFAATRAELAGDDWTQRIGIGEAKSAGLGAHDVEVEPVAIVPLGNAVLPGLEHEADPQVRLGAIVESIADRFEPDELARIGNSAASNAFVPLSDLRAAGVPVQFDRSSNTLALNLAAAQAGSSGGGVGNPASGNAGVGSGTQSRLTATASAGFDSNPFLTALDDAEAASVRVQLAPSISRTSERSSYRVSGRLEHIEYFGDYASLQNFGADIAADYRISERVQIDAGVFVGSDVLAANLANPIIDDGIDVGTPLPPGGNDITILGQAQRRTQYGASAGATFLLSPRDELRWSLTARADRFGSGGGLVESNFFAQQVSYSRRISEGFTIGALLDASLIEFRQNAVGEARTISPQIQFGASLSPRFELDGSIGLSITEIDSGAFANTNTALSGNLSLCRRGELGNFCLNGSRQVLPGAIGGALLQTTGGVSYSLRLSERETFQLRGSYGTASEPVSGQGANFETINGSVRYEHQLDERSRLFVSAGYLRADRQIDGSLTNFQGLVGITFELGKTR